MNLLDLYEMRDPRDAYQRAVANSTSGFGKNSQAYRADGGANDERHDLDQQPTWYIRLNGKLIRNKAGNPYSFQSKAAANKAALTMQAKLFNKDKEFVLTTNPNDKSQGVAEASDQSNAISQEQLNQMYANAKPMMFIKNTPVALVPLAKINQIGTPQQVQQVQQALGSVDQTSYTDEYKNKGYVVFQWNGTALDLYVASPEVVSQKYVKFSGQLPQDEKSRGKIPSLVALSKLGIDPSKVPFFVKKVPTQMVSAKQLGLENKTIQTSWGEQTVSPGGFMVREENGHIYTVAPDAQGLPIGYLPAQQGIAEGAEIMYAEELAEKVFDQSPNLQNEDDILTRGFQLAKKDPRIGGRVNAIFRTEDFPSDFVSYYRWIQHNHGISSGMNEQGMSEGHTEVKDKQGKVVSWKDDSEWHPVEKNKQGQPKDPRGVVTHLSDVARRKTAGQQGMAEAEVDSDGHSVDHADSGEYDYEGDQARDQMNTIVRAARRLDGLLDDNENMPEWVQMKVTLAADYLDTAADYIESNQEPELDEGERGRGRPPAGEQDTTPVMPGRVEKTATGIRHHADSSRYGGTEPDAEDDHLMSKSHISRLGKMTEPDIDEGWRETLGAAALTSAMALGAGGAQARVMPGDDPGINRLTGKPIATQQATDTAPTQSTSSINLAKPQAQYDVDTRILTYKGKQYKWNSDAQATGQGEVVTAPSIAVGSRSMGSTKVELNPNGTYTRAPANESQEKVGNMDADEFDSAMARLKQLAGAGPLKTVYDPTKRVYRNVPVAVQPKK